MISVVLPVYNEEKNIKQTIDSIVDFFNGRNEEYEIIAVNDGSTDRTSEALGGYELDNRVKVVGHKKNIGYGGALRSGFKKAGGNFVFFTDSDGQFDIKDINVFLEKIVNENVVVGYRKKRQDPFYRSLYAYVFRLMARAFFKVEARDIDCAFKLFKKEAISSLDLQENGALINLEIFVRLKQKGYNYIELPVNHFKRKEGKQTGGSIKVLFKAFYNLFKFWFRISRSEPSVK